MKEIEPNIWLNKFPLDYSESGWTQLQGWYFSDDEYLHGPFGSLEETREILVNWNKDLG